MLIRVSQILLPRSNTTRSVFTKEYWIYL